MLDSLPYPELTYQVFDKVYRFVLEKVEFEPSNWTHFEKKHKRACRLGEQRTLMRAFANSRWLNHDSKKRTKAKAEKMLE